MSLQPVQLDENTIIYIETTEERGSRSNAAQQMIQNFANLQDTIKAFADYTLNSFKTIANANVDKVTLEFGVNIGGEAGIPYVTKGSVGSNLKITVQCSFNQTGNQSTGSN